MMKQLTLLALIVALTTLAGCTLTGTNNNTPTSDDIVMGQTQEPIETIDTDEDTMIEIDEPAIDTVAQDQTMTKSAGSYEAYSAAAVTSALSAGKEVVLFFHASRCPSCRNLETAINANSLPDNSVVFKIDYDNSTDLKKKYGVTVQHTLVRIDSDLSMISKNIGGTFTDLVNLF